MSCPIKDMDGEVVGVAQAINKTTINEIFEERDEKVWFTV